MKNKQCILQVSQLNGFLNVLCRIIWNVGEQFVKVDNHFQNHFVVYLTYATKLQNIIVPLIYIYGFWQHSKGKINEIRQHQGVGDITKKYIQHEQREKKIDNLGRREKGRKEALNRC